MNSPAVTELLQAEKASKKLVSLENQITKSNTYIAAIRTGFDASRDECDAMIQETAVWLNENGVNGTAIIQHIRTLLSVRRAVSLLQPDRTEEIRTAYLKNQAMTGLQDVKQVYHFELGTHIVEPETLSKNVWFLFPQDDAVLNVSDFCYASQVTELAIMFFLKAVAVDAQDIAFLNACKEASDTKDTERLDNLLRDFFVQSGYDTQIYGVELGGLL